MTSQDEITRTADRLKDALAAAADVMVAGDRPVRIRGSKTGHGHELLEFGPQPSWRRLRPLAAAASVVAIALVAVLVGHLTGNTGGPAISAAGIGSGSISAPDPAVLKSPGYLAARSRIVKILGVAPSCSREIEGSGFVYAPQHVMTNAHVVAGVSQSQTVTTADGARYNATVVFYDPRTDIAVLYVPALKLAPLRFSTQANPGDSAVVAGYPQNHAFTAVAARISRVMRAEGTDIYQTGTVDRHVYQIWAVVKPGNAGGPLLSPNGTVDGVVFAAVVRPAGGQDIGVALPPSEVQADANAGAHATAPVSTQRCT